MEIVKTIESILSGNSLTVEESKKVFQSIFLGEVNELHLASFLTALKGKGETAEEILGAVLSLRSNSKKPKSFPDFLFVDTCGTGGDGKGSLNVSTLSAFVLASLGIAVAKHGNKSVSSLLGSSDLLEAIGYDWSKVGDDPVPILQSQKFVFLFAVDWHPAMRFAGPVRRALGFRTIFNLLGPFSNPLGPKFQVIGLPTVSHLEILADVALHFPETFLLCHSRDGLDEFSLFLPTDYVLVSGGKKIKGVFDPMDLGLAPDPREVYANSKEGSIALFRKALEGESHSGGDLAALNAGAMLFAMGQVPTIGEGFLKAREVLRSKKVAQYVRETLNCS